MRRFALSLGLVVVLYSQSLLAAEPRAIVDRAIDAVGGMEQLAKHKRESRKEKGVYYGMGDEGLPYTGDFAAEWPGKFRMEIEGVFTMVLNGDKGWTKSPAGTVPLDEKQLAEQQRMNYVGWVTSLAPLKDKKYQLTSSGPAEVDGKAAVGVKVKQEGKPDVELFFDKKSGLLVKTWSRAHSQEQGGKEVDQETFFSEYKDFDGLKQPTKVLIKQDGKKFIETEIVEVKAVKKFDDDVFAEPK